MIQENGAGGEQWFLHQAHAQLHKHYSQFTYLLTVTHQYVTY